MAPTGCDAALRCASIFKHTAEEPFFFPEAPPAFASSFGAFAHAAQTRQTQPSVWIFPEATAAAAAAATAAMTPLFSPSPARAACDAFSLPEPPPPPRDPPDAAGESLCSSLCSSFAAPFAPCEGAACDPLLPFWTIAGGTNASSRFASSFIASCNAALNRALLRIGSRALSAYESLKSSTCSSRTHPNEFSPKKTTSASFSLRILSVSDATSSRSSSTRNPGQNGCPGSFAQTTCAEVRERMVTLPTTNVSSSSSASALSPAARSGSGSAAEGPTVVVPPPPPPPPPPPRDFLDRGAWSRCSLCDRSDASASAAAA
eukprot:29915-Pelagococcus_subviridis.AAC.7